MREYINNEVVHAASIVAIATTHRSSVLTLDDESEVTVPNSFMVEQEPQEGDMYISDGDGRTMKPGDFLAAYSPPPDPEPLVAGVDEIPDDDEVEQVNATDAAFDLAAENDVDLADIEGTGTDGKVTVSDVRDFLK